MPTGNSGWVSKSLAVFAKDIRLELRSRYAVNAILLFAVTTLAVVSFSVGQANLSPELLAALFWVILLFSAVSGLAHSFVREEETATALALRLMADPEPIFVGKLLFNFALLVLMAIIVTPLFFIFTDAATQDWPTFLIVLPLGVVGLGSATTLVAAIIARASVKGALFAVLSFPILIPLVLVLVSATDKVLDPNRSAGVGSEIQFLIAFPVVMITGSVLLFRFVWQE
ncbi:MAG: heme exporter protein CcmB [Candidatus Zixiibacteriota bacterium]